MKPHNEALGQNKKEKFHYIDKCVHNNYKQILVDSDDYRQREGDSSITMGEHRHLDGFSLCEHNATPAANKHQGSEYQPVLRSGAMPAQTDSINHVQQPTRIQFSAIQPIPSFYSWYLHHIPTPLERLKELSKQWHMRVGWCLMHQETVEIKSLIAHFY